MLSVVHMTDNLKTLGKSNYDAARNIILAQFI